MPGTLHVFRLRSEPLEYQANYNLGANSWVQVFNPTELDHFLRHASAMAPDEVDALWEELRATGHSTEGDVHIAESHLSEMGFTESPSDE